MPRRINILSIDGGGIRGVMPAVILDQIEQEVGPLVSAFDLIAGTSTGGIIALGIGAAIKEGKPLAPKDLLALYHNKSAQIFPQGFFHALKGYLGPKYPSDGIEKALQGQYGDARLKSALTPLLIASYDLQTQTPFFFKSEKAKVDPGYDWPVWQVARATSAAPTFFPPLHLVGNGGDYALVDGGIYANNPAVAAYAEARHLYRDATEFVIVSVGTGDRKDSITYDQAKNWGLVGWAKQLIPVIMDSVSEAVDYELDWIVGATANCKHYRLQPKIKAASPDIDNISPTNLNNLETDARTFLQENSARMQEIYKEVKASKPLASRATA